MNKSTEQALSMTIAHMMRIYFGGRTYLGDGQYAVTEQASQAGEALEAYARSNPKLVAVLAREWYSLYPEHGGHERVETPNTIRCEDVELDPVETYRPPIEND